MRTKPRPKLRTILSIRDKGQAELSAPVQTSAFETFKTKILCPIKTECQLTLPHLADQVGLHLNQCDTLSEREQCFALLQHQNTAKTVQEAELGINDKDQRRCSCNGGVHVASELPKRVVFVRS